MPVQTVSVEPGHLAQSLRYFLLELPDAFGKRLSRPLGINGRQAQHAWVGELVFLPNSSRMRFRQISMLKGKQPGITEARDTSVTGNTQDMSQFKELITLVAYGIEAIGVLVILIGCVAGTMRLLHQLKSKAISELYHEYRQVIGRSILMGLEFLIAGDVIRTVIVSHTITDVAVLALMVLIRTFLSFTLTLEIEGKLPWEQQRPISNSDVPRE